MYAKDISKKVRSSIIVKKQNGEFVGKLAPYGYIKDPKDKHKFLIDKNVSTLIKKGKNVILDNVSKNIEETFTNQLEGIEKLSKYENNWKNYYKEKDFDGMEREYQKIKSKLNELMPLENTIKEARTIENIHEIIKNNGQNFELDENQIKLAQMLTVNV